jgi:hypothetical protein
MCAKIASCALNLCSAKQHIKFAIKENAKFSVSALWGFVIPVYGWHRTWGVGIVARRVDPSPLNSVQSANADLSTIGFCILFLLGSKYDCALQGSAKLELENTIRDLKK